ncbi:MAG: (2Fe-2S)-binding protein [Herpetosiphonaceae bacterium]|nr:MAG: (2Fe-2S)-binding protein [Herpetosiphonaceae bacterium]
MASFVTVARIGEIPEGEGRAFTIDGVEIGVFNCGGTYYATNNICSHAYAELHEGYLDCDEHTIECPLHGSMFDLRTGQPRTLPATTPVEVYAVRVEGDEIQIGLPD